MNKKEQAKMEELRNQLAIARAFRFTDPVQKDVPPPENFSELSKGWTYNAHSKTVSKSCSSSVSHAIGSTDKTNSQKPISMYSSKLLALRALRHDLEQKFAEELARIDKLIEMEVKGG